jgi:translation initiation factor IF-2
VLVTEAREKPASEEKSASQGAGVVSIPLIVKGDVLGSTEAVIHELKKIETEQVKLKIVDASAGAITENDVKQLSGTPGGIVVGFAVKSDPRALELAERQGVVIQTFDIIYKLSEWMTGIIAGRTPKTEVEEIQGTLKVLKIFNKHKDTQVIGGAVQIGKIAVNDSFKILRRGTEIGHGKIEELQLQKIKAREVNEGNECGVQVESKIEIAGGDVLESFTISIK